MRDSYSGPCVWIPLALPLPIPTKAEDSDHDEELALADVSVSGSGNDIDSDQVALCWISRKISCYACTLMYDPCYVVR